MMDHITEETCPLCQRDLACSVDHKSRSMLELISPLFVDISTKYKLDKSRFPGLEEERRHGRFEPVLVLASDPRARRMTRAVRRLQQTNHARPVNNHKNTLHYYGIHPGNLTRDVTPVPHYHYTLPPYPNQHNSAQRVPYRHCPRDISYKTTLSHSNPELQFLNTHQQHHMTHPCHISGSKQLLTHNTIGDTGFSHIQRTGGAASRRKSSSHPNLHEMHNTYMSSESLNLLSPLLHHDIQVVPTASSSGRYHHVEQPESCPHPGLPVMADNTTALRDFMWYKRWCHYVTNEQTGPPNLDISQIDLDVCTPDVNNLQRFSAALPCGRLLNNYPQSPTSTLQNLHINSF